jgi:hypothetical protein
MEGHTERTKGCSGGGLGGGTSVLWPMFAAASCIFVHASGGSAAVKYMQSGCGRLATHW